MPIASGRRYRGRSSSTKSGGTCGEGRRVGLPGTGGPAGDGRSREAGEVASRHAASAGCRHNPRPREAHPGAPLTLPWGWRPWRPECPPPHPSQAPRWRCCPWCAAARRTPPLAPRPTAAATAATQAARTCLRRRKVGRAHLSRAAGVSGARTTRTSWGVWRRRWQPARPPQAHLPPGAPRGGRPGHTLTASRQPAPRIHSWLRSCSCAVVGGRRAAAGMGQRRGGRCGAGHSSTPASAAQRAPAHPARMPPTMKASLRLISRPRTRAGLDSAAAEAAETCSQHRRSLSSRHAGCSEACRMQQSPRTGHHQPRLQCRRAQRAWRTQFRPRTAAAPP